MENLVIPGWLTLVVIMGVALLLITISASRARKRAITQGFIPEERTDAFAYLRKHPEKMQEFLRTLPNPNTMEGSYWWDEQLIAKPELQPYYDEMVRLTAPPPPTPRPMPNIFEDATFQRHWETPHTRLALLWWIDQIEQHPQMADAHLDALVAYSKRTGEPLTPLLPDPSTYKGSFWWNAQITRDPNAADAMQRVKDYYRARDQ